MYCILSPQGTVTDADALEALNLDAATILHLYECMVRTRCFTEKATAEGSLKRMPIYISPRVKKRPKLPVLMRSVQTIGRSGMPAPRERRLPVACRTRQCFNSSTARPTRKLCSISSPTR